MARYRFLSWMLVQSAIRLFDRMKEWLRLSNDRRSSKQSSGSTPNDQTPHVFWQTLQDSSYEWNLDSIWYLNTIRLMKIKEKTFVHKNHWSIPYRVNLIMNELQLIVLIIWVIEYVLKRIPSWVEDAPKSFDRYGRIGTIRENPVISRKTVMYPRYRFFLMLYCSTIIQALPVSKTNSPFC